MKKNNKTQDKTCVQSGSSIKKLVQHLPAYRSGDPKVELIIKKRMFSESICHICLYGNKNEDYINHSLVFPANNPKIFADQITKDVIGQIFPPDFHPEFNQYVSISTSLLVDRFEELSRTLMTSQQIIEKILSNQEEFITHEIDAVIYVNSAEVQEKWIEIKMFTCPNQSSKVINRLLQPKELKYYFLKNDFLGLMGFSLICTKDGVPIPYQKFRPIELEGMSTWMIHFILCDQGICNDPRPTSELADWILSQIQFDLDEMSTELDLYNHNCFFKMTENFVKVVKMAQLLEEYKEEILQERKAKEDACRQIEVERKAKEVAQSKIRELEQELAKYKKSQ